MSSHHEPIERPTVRRAVTFVAATLALSAAGAGVASAHETSGSSDSSTADSTGEDLAGTISGHPGDPGLDPVLDIGPALGSVVGVGAGDRGVTDGADLGLPAAMASPSPEPHSHHTPARVRDRGEFPSSRPVHLPPAQAPAAVGRQAAGASPTGSTTEPISPVGSSSSQTIPIRH
jgi:hypothetical protein